MSLARLFTIRTVNAGHENPYRDRILVTWRRLCEIRICPHTVDYFRLLFAYTGSHVQRTGQLEARGGSVQGLRRKYPGAGGDDAVAAHRGQVSALP